MDQKIYDTAVVGGGPAGYTAALYCARSGLSVAVLEKLSPGGQMATTGQVDNYPGFDGGVDGFELGERMQRGAERFGAETKFATVLSADLAGRIKRIETSDGPLLARTVILATGAYPRELGLADERALRGRGVAYCAACDGRMYRGKTVVVSGGGNSAAEDAAYLARICKKVYLVHRRDTLRASRAEQDALLKSGVEILWNTKVVQLLYEKRLTGVVLADVATGIQRTLACDGLFVAIGRVPDTKLFAPQVPTDAAGYFVADETTRTGLPGVFAAGDARAKPLRQIVTAAADGAVAAHFAEVYLAQEAEG